MTITLLFSQLYFSKISKSPLFAGIICKICGQTVVLLEKIWRRWESNPRPKWIKINLYVCRYLFSRLTQENIKTWQANPRFYLRETLNPWWLSWCVYHQSTHCVLHNGPIKPASWVLWVARISDLCS